MDSPGSKHGAALGPDFCSATVQETADASSGFAPAPSELRLARPPTGDRRPWFAAYYRRGHVKERDRTLFVR